MTADALLAAILRGEHVESAVLAAEDADALCERAVAHDVLPLVAQRLTARADTPALLLARLRRGAHEAVVLDLVSEAALRLFLTTLDDAGLKVLLVKGSHLAYSHYARPDLRSRIDSDILIRMSDREAIHLLLTELLGYEVSTRVSGDLTATQSSVARYDGEVLAHVIDVHWRLSSPQVFANVLSYDELAARAVSLPRLGRGAYGPSDMHALLIACVHQVAHHAGEVHLKWLYDIHVIAGGLDAGQWKEFVDLALEREVAAVCRHSLDITAATFHTPIPAAVLNDRRLLEAHEDERSAAYLRPRPQAQMVLDDLRALSSWNDRWRLVREHVFPSAEYMRRTYAPASAAPLPLLYAARFVRGAWKWLRLS